MLNKVIAVAEQAGQMMLDATEAAVYKKEGHYNFVTETDLRVQEMIHSMLSGLLPEADFYAEEQENAPMSEGLTWVVDPIDGTLNYMRHRDCSAVSVALMKNRQPILGVIRNPFRQETFSAEAGKGAALNGKTIRVSEIPFENAMVAFGTAPYNSELAERTLKAAKTFLLEAGDLRRCGSAALDLCDVACGRSDCYFEMILSPWDFAAGALIVREAGGIFTAVDMPETVFDRKAAVLASNRLCLEPALRILKKD